ncbi:MAG TPA: hypothetical protein VK541_15565 [Pedobacter sp.]|uniref:hypothetical protein n=1 Tax=Pedobacter sp. TaxID=1411316 RepID=UPI002C90CFA3|nr:hypothetical protein [Pedobacter sp.]HMI03903.1 hypothetical protein [Pedobacter sp.]
MKHFYLKIFYICLVSLVFAALGRAQVKPGRELMDSAGRKTLNEIKEGASKSLKEKSALLKEKSALLSSKKKMVGDSLKKNKPFDLSNIVLENSALVTGSGLAFRSPKAMNNFSVFGQVKVFGFPLAIDFANNSDEFERLDPMSDGLFKMNFDRSQYQQLYKNDLEKFSRFKKNQLSGLDMSDYLKKGISEALKSTMNLDLGSFPRLNAVLNSREQLSALLTLDENQIRARVDELLSDQRQSGFNKLDSLSDSKKFQVQEEINKKKVLVADQVVALKQKIEDNGLDQQRLLLVQKFVTNRGSLDDLEAIFDNEMKQQGKLTGASKFYSKIKALQVGNFGQKMPGSFLNRDQMVKGANFTFKTGRGPVNLGFGMNKDTGMPKDAGFDNSMYDTQKILTYLSVPTNNFSFGSGKISWIGSFDQQTKQGFNQMNSLPKNGLSFVVSQDLRFNSAGKFTLEVSKSSVQYKNISISESDKLVLNRDLKAGNYFRDDFLETMAFGVKHNIELKKFGLVSNTFFSYSGLGHQNPGQQGYSNMGMRAGGNLKKSILRNKIVLNVRTDIKNTPISAVSGAHWKNYNLNLDSRFKVSKNYSFNLKYAENGVNKVDGSSTSVYASQKFQADMNSNYKVGTSYGLSNLSVGKQSMLNPVSNINSDFATVLYSQTFLLKSFSLSGNAFYNRELGGEKILGDMLNADVGCQYTLLKNLSVSSAVTYLDNQNVARQVGLRQNVQVTVLRNFDLSAFVDVRKNLINPLYPDLFSTGRGEVSIRYYLRK